MVVFRCKYLNHGLRIYAMPGKATIYWKAVDLVGSLMGYSSTSGALKRRIPLDQIKRIKNISCNESSAFILTASQIENSITLFPPAKSIRLAKFWRTLWTERWIVVDSERFRLHLAGLRSDDDQFTNFEIIKAEEGYGCSFVELARMVTGVPDLCYETVIAQRPVDAMEVTMDVDDDESTVNDDSIELSLNDSIELADDNVSVTNNEPINTEPATNNISVEPVNNNSGASNNEPGPSSSTTIVVGGHYLVTGTQRFDKLNYIVFDKEPQKVIALKWNDEKVVYFVARDIIKQSPLTMNDFPFVIGMYDETYYIFTPCNQ